LQIRGLLDLGLSTKVIRDVLPCLDNPCTLHAADAGPELLATLERERRLLDERIACLTCSRDAIVAYLAVVRTTSTAPPDAC
jgi:DNA-binding transcriptional MerR regulator